MDRRGVLSSLTATVTVGCSGFGGSTKDTRIRSLGVYNVQSAQPRTVRVSVTDADGRELFDESLELASAPDGATGTEFSRPVEPAAELTVSARTVRSPDTSMDDAVERTFTSGCWQVQVEPSLSGDLSIYTASCERTDSRSSASHQPPLRRDVPDGTP